MFSGIIEELGAVEKIQRKAGMVNLTITAKTALEDTKIGDSIAINGACLTVTSIDKSSLTFDAISETLKKTNLGDIKIQDKVNLERSLKLGDRISGHLVSGHIDCVGIIREKRQASGNWVITIAIPSEFSKNVILKGSVAVDGISLTIAEVRGNVFSVHIIPHTAKATTLGSRGPSHKINIEFDLIGKNVISALQKK